MFVGLTDISIILTTVAIGLTGYSLGKMKMQKKIASIIVDAQNNINKWKDISRR